MIPSQIAPFANPNDEANARKAQADAGNQLARAWELLAVAICFQANATGINEMDWYHLVTLCK